MDAKFSRYTTTEYNRKVRLLSRLNDLFGRARAFGLSHSQMLDASSEILNSLDWRKASGYTRQYFFGRQDALMDQLYQTHLEWRIYVDGALVDSDSVKDWSKAHGGAYVWRAFPDRIFSDGNQAKAE